MALTLTVTLALTVTITVTSIGAFFNYFYYMAHRGTSSLPTPLPPEAPPSTVYPSSYTPHQLLFAWNWRASPYSALGQVHPYNNTPSP